MTVRPAEEKDIPLLARLEEEAFSRPLTEEDFVAALGSETYSVIVAEEYGKPVGLTVFYAIPPTAELLSVTVAADFRRKGVGKALLTETFRLASEAGNTEMLLDVRCSNRGAITLYQSLGFEQIAKRKDFYDRPVEDGYTMRVGLERKPL